MKKYLVIFIFLMIPNFLLGDTTYADTNAYITDFPVFVNGDVQSIENSFKFIKILLSDSDFVNTIVTLMAFILTGLAGWRTFKTQAISGAVVNAMYLTTGVLSLTGAIPVDVHIEDQRTQIDYTKYGGINYAKVEGIPFPIAALISASSALTLSLVEKVEDATVDVDSDQVSAQAIGFASAFSDVTKIINYAKYSSDTTSSIFEQVLVEYISTCILDKAYYSGTVQKDIIRKVRNPQKDIFKELNAATLGISSEIITFTDSAGNSYGTCGDLYSYLSTNYTRVADDTLALLDKSLTGSGVYIDMSKVTNAKISDSLISGELGQFKAYVMNVAAVGPISRAIRNSSGTTVSGQDLANSITLEATKAKIQSDGAGQFRWMAEVLPMGYHFMLGIIYSCSVFVMIVSIAMGYEKGFALISNYAQGLLSFEFIKVGLEMANNHVNQYSKFHAADILSALGSNPASIENLPYHLEYIASMTGLAGLLGVGAIFIIPTIVFTGKVAVAAGALSGLGGQYRGNAVDTATNTVAGQRAKEEAFNESLRMSHALEKAGYTVPANMGAGDYYSQMQKDVSESSKALSLATMGSGAIMDVGKADGMTEMSNVATKQTLANGTTASQHIASGTASGATQAGSVIGTSEFVEDMGINGLEQGSKIQSLKEKYGVDASGKTMTEEQAKQVGVSSGSFQNMQDITLVESRKNAKLLDDDNMATDLTKKSMINRFAKESAEYAGVGKATVTSDDLNNFETQGRGKFEETAIGAKAYSDKATKDGVLTDGYKDAVYGSEGAKIGAMIATTEAMGGSAKQIAFSEASATVKAAEDVSGFKSKLNEAGLSKEDAENFGKNAGEAFNKAVEKLAGVADAKVGAQTRSDIDTIATAGGNEGYKSTVARLSAAQMGANIATMNEADKLGGYENYLNMSAREKVGTGIESLAGKKEAKTIDSTGALTETGRATVRGSSRLDAEKQIGNVKGMKNVMHDNPQYIESYVNQSIVEAEKAGRKEAVMTDFEKAGLITKDDKGGFKVNSENFAEAKAFLNANNMNSHNALVAGGMVLSGALGENSTVQASAINSASSGDKEDFYNKQKSIHNTESVVGKALREHNGDFAAAAKWLQAYDNVKWSSDWKNQLYAKGADVSDILGADEQQTISTAGTFGAVAATVAGGIALESLTAKLNPEKIKMTADDLSAKNGFTANEDGTFSDKHGEKYTTKDGNVYNSKGEMQEKNNPNKNKGLVSKSWGGIKNKSRSSGEDLSPFSGEEKPLKETENGSGNNSNEHGSDSSENKVHNDSSKKDNNESIPQKKESLNSKNRQSLEDALNKQSKANGQAVDDGKMTVDKFIEEEQKHDRIRKDVDNGNLHSKALTDVGIKPSSMGLEVGDKGFIDIRATNEKVADFETRKAAKMASMELMGEDTTLLKESNGLIRNNDTIQKDLDENQKNVENNSKLKDSISQAEGFKSKFESGGTFTKNDLTGVNGFKEQTVLGDMNQNINSVKDAISNTTDAQELSRLQNNLEELQSIKDKFTSGGNITKQELMDSTGMKKDDILSRVNDHIESAKGQFANTMAPDRVEGLQNQMKANDLLEKGTTVGEHTQSYFAKRLDDAEEIMTSSGLGWKSKIALAASTMILGSQSEVFANTLNAVDPTQLIMGPDLGAGSDIVSNHQLGAPLLTNSDMQRKIMSDMATFSNKSSSGSTSPDWQNGKSAMDSVDTNAFSNELKTNIQNSGRENNKTLMSNSNTMHLNSIGGAVDIGQNNDRMMRVNGMQTQIPYDDFQQQMQTNPQMRGEFASLISASDITSSGGRIDNSTATMDSLMEQVNQKFNIQEMMSISQMKNLNMMGSYSAEILEKSEEMFSQIENFQETIQDLNKKD